jgi:hypothetical protein
LEINKKIINYLFAINKNTFTFAPMNIDKKKRGRPEGTKKEPTKIYARRIKQSKYAELAPQLDQLINQFK